VRWACQMTGIPLFRLEEKESQPAASVEESSEEHSRQEKAITILSRTLRRARAGLNGPAPSIGTSMFLGPTGVGKTEIGPLAGDFPCSTMSSRHSSRYVGIYGEVRVSRLMAPPGYVGYEEGAVDRKSAAQRTPWSLLDESKKRIRMCSISAAVFDDGSLTIRLAVRSISRIRWSL